MPAKTHAYLFGPFFGELSWEYFRFSPYAIHLKKTEPETQIVVMTRPERFDLYGQYADVLVPLLVQNDDMYEQKAFKLLGFDIAICQNFVDIFKNKYIKRYHIKEHFVPDFSTLRYTLKWQFPRGKMDYDFIPRQKNIKVINNLTRKKNVVVVDDRCTYKTGNYQIISLNDFKRYLNIRVDGKTVTYMGCLIELLKRAKFTVSNLKSDIGKLSILLKTPLIYPQRDISNDHVFLMNPYNTDIIDCENIEEGVKFYENYI